MLVHIKKKKNVHNSLRLEWNFLVCIAVAGIYDSKNYMESWTIRILRSQPWKICGLLWRRRKKRKRDKETGSLLTPLWLFLFAQERQLSCLTVSISFFSLLCFCYGLTKGCIIRKKKRKKLLLNIFEVSLKNMLTVSLGSYFLKTLIFVAKSYNVFPAKILIRIQGHTSLTGTPNNGW